MHVRTTKSWRVSIYMAGDYDVACEAATQFCSNHGLTVHIEPTVYLTVTVAKPGIIIHMVNYPRFPSIPEVMLKNAQELGLHVMTALNRTMFCIETPDLTYWYTNDQNLIEMPQLMMVPMISKKEVVINSYIADKKERSVI